MKSHRGLSAVVGTVFLVAVVIGALSYVSYSLDTIGNFSQSMIVEESRQKDKQSESFEISSIDVTGASKLDGVVKNTGEVPLKLTTLWIDEQEVNDIVQKFTLDVEIAPGNTVDLNSLVDFTMDSDKGYNMKVVSSRGAVNSFYVNSLANEDVYMTLSASPSIIPSTFTSTLLFTVVNNMSNGNYLYNLTPVMNDTKQTLDDLSNGLTYDMIGNGPTPATYDSLGPGEVAVFTYEIQLTGETDNDMQLFNVTLANANLGNEALTNVSVKAVPLATDAGSALTSLGLTETTSDLTDVLYFHDDTTLTPNNEYPMDGSSPNSSGLTKSPNGNTLSFISAGMTEQTTVPLGKFNTTMTYYSSLTPLDIPEPDFAFMMDCYECGDNGNEMADSTGNLGNNGFEEQSGDPEFFSTGGPDGDGYYHFDDSDNDYFWDEWSVGGGVSDIDDYPDATAVWVRIESGAEDDVAIVEAAEWDDEVGHAEYYGIYFADGGEINYGGTNDDVDSIPFTGAEGAAEVEDLYYTNYGNNGTRLHYKIEIMDALGTTVEHEVIPLTKLELPFKDVAIGNYDDQSTWIDVYTSNTTDQKYHGDANDDTDVFINANLTASSTGVATLEVGELLKVTIDWNGFEEQNLPINIMFDDSGGWALPNGPTFLQTPEPTPRWPTFLSFDSREEVSYRAFNEGPEGVWFTYGGTRLVLTSLDGTTSYGATPHYVNQTTAPSQAEALMDGERDSMYIPDQHYAVIDFWPIQAPPDANDNWSCQPECEVPDGDYDAALYLQGYDEAGETFKKTVNLGLVHITGNPP